MAGYSRGYLDGPCVLSVQGRASEGPPEAGRGLPSGTLRRAPLRLCPSTPNPSEEGSQTGIMGPARAGIDENYRHVIY